MPDSLALQPAADSHGRRARLRPARQYRPWAVAASVALIALSVLVNFYAMREASAPVWTDDEIGVLANARVIAGVGEPWELANLGYYPGWSVALAPLWWLTEDPASLYRLAVALSAACAVLAIVPLGAVARMLGTRPDVAYALAAVVTLAPARSVMSNYALSENFLMLSVSVAVWAALRFSAHQTMARAALLGAAVAYTFFTHGRTVPIVIATLLWFGWLLLRRQYAVALVGGLVTAGATVLAYVVNTSIAATLYGTAGARESSAASRMLDGTPQSIARAILGQGWYVSSAWLGLAVLGGGAVLVMVAKELARRRPDVATWYTLVVLGVATISVLFIARPIARGSARLDVVAYGRYLDPFAEVLALVGLVVLVQGLKARAGYALLAAVAVVSAAFLWLIPPRIPDGGWWGPINVAGLLSWTWPSHLEEWSPPWIAVSLTAVVVVAVVVVARRAPAVGVGVVALVFTAGSINADRTSVANFNEINQGPAELLPVIEQIEALTDEPVSFDRSGADVRSQNLYQFWLGAREVEVFRSLEEPPPTDFVISRIEPGAEVWEDATRVAVGGTNAIWVLPGDLHDRLEAAGLISGA